jgi:hypothetical protein
MHKLLVGCGPVNGRAVIGPFNRFGRVPKGVFATMQTLRTPDERFANLPEFPYPPKYCEISQVTAGSCGWHGWKTIPSMPIRC